MQRSGRLALLGGGLVGAGGFLLLGGPASEGAVSSIDAPSSAQAGALLLSADPPMDPECASRPECTRFGRCALRDGACVAAHEEHCAASGDCLDSGACGLDDDRCAPLLDVHCEASAPCRAEGACALQDGRCAPSSPQHCQASEGCRQDGMCRLLSDDLGVRCGVETHHDCALSALCRTHGRCRVAPVDFGGAGRCIAAELTPRERFPLRSARHGIDGQLVVRSDARAADHPSVDERGYWPDADDPLAAAALELRDHTDVLRDELTLYPDVKVAIEDLGTGTDTFLATERVSCAAGHWCGWTTVFLEVRGGRLARLSARDGRGEERPLEVTASSGSRWMLARGSQRRLRDVVEQVEGPVPSAPALVETRFSFRRGGFRYTERQWLDYRPGVAQQRGPWHGSLEFHAH